MYAMKRFRTYLPLVLIVLGFGAASSPQSAHAQQEMSWQLLMQADFEEEVTSEDGIIWKPKFPEAVQQLDGKTIRLMGYMIPLGMEEAQTHFLLSAFPGHGCFFHMPGGPAAIVEVQASKAALFSYDPVAVEGRLHVLHEDPYGLLYRITDAKPVQ